VPLAFDHAPARIPVSARPQMFPEHRFVGLLDLKKQGIGAILAFGRQGPEVQILSPRPVNALHINQLKTTPAVDLVSN